MSNKNFETSLQQKGFDNLIKPVNSPNQWNEKEKKEETYDTVVSFRSYFKFRLQIQAVAFWHRKDIQDIFNEALQTYLKWFEWEELEKMVDEYQKHSKLKDKN